MRFIVLVVGLPVADGLALVSALANWRFGVRLGAEEGDAFAYGLASVCADGLKVLLPFVIAWAWARRRVAEWLSAGALWLVITTYSLVSALSFAAVNRAEITGRRQAEGHAWHDLRSDLAAKREARSRLQIARPAAAIETEVRLGEQSPRFALSNGCKEMDGRDVRSFCERHLRLVGELAAARRAEALDAEIATLRARLDRLPMTAGTVAADPQLDLFKELSGLGEGRIKAALAILVCLLIELGSGLGLFVVMSYARALAQDSRTEGTRPGSLIDITPGVVPTDDDWAQVRLDRSAKSTIGAAELYADYRLWMEARGRGDVLSVTGFGRWMSDLGIVREKLGGRIVYVGVRLRPDGRALTLRA